MGVTELLIAAGVIVLAVLVIKGLLKLAKWVAIVFVILFVGQMLLEHFDLLDKIPL